MAHTTLTSLFSDIADAIRAKTGSSAAIVADNFPSAIAAISTGTVATATKEVSGSGNTREITFTVSGDPQAWSCMLTTAAQAYGSMYYVAAQYDGTTVNAWTKSGTYYSDVMTSSYSNGTLTITIPSSNYSYWHNGTWSLIYTY